MATFDADSATAPAAARFPFSADSAPILSGTLPVRPFGERFFGYVEADGQRARVAALACTPDGGVVLLSLVGYDTSLGAVLAHLHANKILRLTVAEDIPWEGSRDLRRLACGSRHISTSLLGTREKHALAFATAVDIAQGLLQPPHIPARLARDSTAGRAQRQEELEAGDVATTQDNAQDAATSDGSHVTLPTVLDAPPDDPTRYVLGNADERSPARSAIRGQLRALRIVHLPTWDERLWQAGSSVGLIAPLPAIGVCAWRLSGDLAAWSALIGGGVRDGWLPLESAPESTAESIPESAPDISHDPA